jgi:ribosomal protein S18 acetylase RimI-like enzyme
VNYCRANLLDLFPIEQMEKDCFSAEAFNRHTIKNLLINPKSIIIKATTPSGEIIGITKKENNSPAGKIHSLCVLEKYREKGIATHLVQLLEDEFYLQGIKKFKLEVSTSNTIAQRFYKRHGYRRTDAILPEFYNDGSDAFVMSKYIP